MLRDLLNKANEPYSEDRALARRMLRQDDRAITEFIDSYFPRLYRFALTRMGRDSMAAEDVVQETVMIAARRIETYRGDASLLSWLTRILIRELVRHEKRRERRETVIRLFDDEEMMAGLAESQDGAADIGTDHVEQVHYVLDRLPNRSGDLLEWKYIEGLSIREIGDRVALVGRDDNGDDRIARTRHDQPLLSCQNPNCQTVMGERPGEFGRRWRS